jgi:phospholipid/cholesterol/gamma-HCH transport system permease protein
MAIADKELTREVTRLGAAFYEAIATLGDLGIFATQTLGWLSCRRPSPGTLLPALYYVGVRSWPVVAITGMFIGMVLAVQTYNQFRQIGLATHLGGIINMSVVSELGPVLAATMLAGRVGSAMAAELGTMRTTEQIDALACLGVNPVHYLVVPRFLACVLLIPLLTVVADTMGILGGSLVTTGVYHVDSYAYWQNSRGFVTPWDLCTGLIKAVFFGGTIALISCQRGFSSTGGAQGVGRAATEAFVLSFIFILALDLFLGLFLNQLYYIIWPGAAARRL